MCIIHRWRIVLHNPPNTSFSIEMSNEDIYALCKFTIKLLRYNKNLITLLNAYTEPLRFNDYPRNDILPSTESFSSTVTSKRPSFASPRLMRSDKQRCLNASKGFNFCAIDVLG